MSTLSLCVVAIVLSGTIGTALAQIIPEPRHSSNGSTPVSGDSWLTHISRPFNETSMGKATALGPGPDDQDDTRSTAPNLVPPIAETTLSGADLYRLNCQGCHGAEGLGVPPEINSVINPVRATSASLVLQRMKSRGIDFSPPAANELAKEAVSALRKRLHEGGENMPSFSYLSESEVGSLLEYLDQLAAVPGATKSPKLVRESPERVGELVVKSTCHICHGATGPNPTEQQLYDGQIPPLEVLPTRADQTKFVRKITQGLPILMGEPPELYRGRMPVFHYITSEEAADAYLYLNYYPPVSRSRSTPVVSSIQQPSASTTGGGGSSHPNTEAQDRFLETHSDEGLPTSTVLLITGLFGFVLVLVAGGFAFTIREFSRTSGGRAESHIPNIIPSEKHPEETPLVPRMNAVGLKPFHTT